jgi:hypothetical protein
MSLSIHNTTQSLLLPLAWIEDRGTSVSSRPLLVLKPAGAHDSGAGHCGSSLLSLDVALFRLEVLLSPSSDPPPPAAGAERFDMAMVRNKTVLVTGIRQRLFRRSAIFIDDLPETFSDIFGRSILVQTS